MADPTSGLRPRSQHTELVALRVRHDHPAHVPLTDVRSRRAGALEPGDLGGLVVRVEVAVQATLHRLSFGHIREHQSWPGIVVARDGDLVLRFEYDLPSEDARPELRLCPVIRAIDLHAPPFAGHAIPS